MVREWNQLTAAYNKALPSLEADPTLGGARARLVEFGVVVSVYSHCAQALLDRGQEFGVEKDSNLARVLAAQEPKRAIASLLDTVEANFRHDMKLAAEQKAAEEAAREAARQLERSLYRGRGMSPG
jgi:hypothetical protein